MCRIFGYLGAPRALAELLFAPPHGLPDQARHPRELPPGVVGADGFGVCWYTKSAPEPARYRNVMPIWSDENLPEMSAHLLSGCVIASIRSASQGMPVTLANSPPYVRGTLSLAHNGTLEAFGDRWLARMRAELPPAMQAGVVGNTDSEHVLALLATEMRDESPTADGLARATQRVLARCRAWSDEFSCQASLNLLVSDGTSLVVTRAAFRAEQPPSLYLWRSELESARGVVIASEPTFDDSRWSPVPPGALLIVEEGARVREWSLPG